MIPAPDITTLLPDPERQEALKAALMNEIEAQPSKSTSTQPLLKRRPIQLSFTSVALAGAAAVVISTTDIGGEHLSVADKAQAAIAADNSIIHSASTFRFVSGGGFGTVEIPGRGRFENTGASENWATTNPERSRTIQWYAKAGNPRAAYTEGTFSRRTHTFLTRDSWRKGIRRWKMNAKEARSYDARENRLQRDPLGPNGAYLQEIPIQTVQALLKSDRFKSAGTGVIDGKRVVRLTAVSKRYRQTNVDVNGKQYKTWAKGAKYLFFVDAKTYLPVEVRTEQPVAGNAKDNEPATSVKTVTKFSKVERIPLTSKTEKLLQLDTAGRKVIEVK